MRYEDYLLTLNPINYWPLNQLKSGSTDQFEDSINGVTIELIGTLTGIGTGEPLLTDDFSSYGSIIFHPDNYLSEVDATGLTGIRDMTHSFMFYLEDNTSPSGLLRVSGFSYCLDIVDGRICINNSSSSPSGYANYLAYSDDLVEMNVINHISVVIHNNGGYNNTPRWMVYLNGDLVIDTLEQNISVTNSPTSSGLGVIGSSTTHYFTNVTASNSRFQYVSIITRAITEAEATRLGRIALNRDTQYVTKLYELNPSQYIPLDIKTNSPNAYSAFTYDIIGNIMYTRGTSSVNTDFYVDQDPLLPDDSFSRSMQSLGTNFYLVNQSGSLDLNTIDSTISFIINLNDISHNGGIIRGIDDRWFCGVIDGRISITDLNLGTPPPAYNDSTVVWSDELTSMTTYHVSLVFKASGGVNNSPLWSIWINGEKHRDSLETGSEPTTVVENCHVRTIFAGQGYMKGSMQHVSSFTRALAPNELQDLGRSAFLSIDEGLVQGAILENRVANSFIINCHDQETGLLVKRVKTSDVLFDVYLPLYREHYIVIIADQGDAWTENKTVNLDELIHPNDVSATPYYFKCTTAGITGLTEPSWQTANSATTTDGTVIWTVVEPLNQPITHALVRTDD